MVSEIKREQTRGDLILNAGGPEIELISKEDFLRSHPEHQSLDAHQLHLKRLLHELDERKRLVAEVKAAERRKTVILQSNTEKQQFLDDLAGKVKAIYQDATALQQRLPVVAEVNPVPDTANQLPVPLYVLYHAANCYISSFAQQSLQVAITTDTQSNRPEHTSTQAGFHPLSITLTLIFPLPSGSSTSAQLRFFYREQPGVVAVSVTVQNAASSPTLLTNLYPDDDGTLLPVGLTPEERKCGWDRATFGSAYRWAQNLAGLHFVPSYADQLHRRPVTLAAVLSAVHHRVLVQASLMQQISCLSRRAYAHDDTRHTKASFREWNEITSEDFHQATPVYTPSSSTTITSPSSSSSSSGPSSWSNQDSRYFAVLFSKHREGDLKVLIQVTSEYPIRPPIIKLFFSSKSSSSSSVSNEEQEAHVNALAHIEATVYNALPNDTQTFETAIEAEENGTGFMLSRLLFHIHSCFDVLIMASRQSSTGSGSMFKRPVHGRDRRHPYRWDKRERVYCQ